VDQGEQHKTPVEVEVEAGVEAEVGNLCIVGLGLMGASLALGLRARASQPGFPLRIRRYTGVARREETVRASIERGIVDAATTDFAACVGEADVVVLAAPVRTILSQLRTQAGAFKPGATITDLGSTKAEIVRAMGELPDCLHAVGSHPMCGKEVTGLDAADADLYQGKRWILTRTARSDDASFDLVQRLALAAGAKTLELDATRHDRLVAFASHLPYALAVALVTAADQAGLDDPTLWQVTASGFRDTSRLASSDVTMMLDILMTNREAVSGAIRDFQFTLDQLTALLERQDEAGLRAYLAAAAEARKVKGAHW
jgi:prephenate dehydrogenase